MSAPPGPQLDPREQEVGRIVARCEELFLDLDLGVVQQWKAAAAGRRAIGFLPVYVPREVLHAAGALPVGIMGGGDQLEIIRGDACFQSYLCHLPRSVVELGLSGRLDCLDGMLFPSICDVIRNLSGIWQMTFPDRYVHYVDLPQNFDPAIGGAWYRHELEALLEGVVGVTGQRPSDAALRASIEAYNLNRRRHEELYALRREEPWRAPAWEVYLVTRAGNVLPVEEHSGLIEQYLAAARERPGRPRDMARVVVSGSFCEQPPLDLIRTLERAGCYIVDDDYVLGARFLRGDVEAGSDPLGCLARAYLEQCVAHASVYIGTGEKGADLVRRVQESRAEGVLFAAPSFCDPALLDQPMLQAALERAGVPSTSFKYSEDTGQFQVIREQAGTFADTIKLWSEA